MNPKVSQKAVAGPSKQGKSLGSSGGPAVYQPQNAAHVPGRTAASAKSPAPPVYRPQMPAQAKPKAAGVVAPPVYRPQLPVQAKPKTAGVVAPPVYRPQVPAQAKPKAAGVVAPAVFRSQGIGPKPSGASAPPVYRASVLQMVKVKKPAGLTLTGGNGVSVIWKKSSKSDLPHVSVGHGKASSDGMIEVTNFHYKFDRIGYYHWDDDGKGNFKFRGGRPSKGVYVQTQKGATRFGIKLEKPANIVEEEAEEARLAKEAAEQAAAAKLAAEKAPKPLVSKWDGEDGYVAPKVAAATASTSEPLGAWDDEWS